VTVEVNASEARGTEAVRTPAAPADSYARDIARGLDRAFESDETETQTLDLADARLIVFSDHHRGSRDGADDFLRCEQAYQAALGYYLEAGHRLFAVGDVDELWECPPGAVLEAYVDTLALEAEFHKDGRLERFWGNHDDSWRSQEDVEKLLGKEFPKLKIREALKVEVTDAGERKGLLFFAHGHQGTKESDRFAWFSKAVVRHVWRPLQRRLNMASTTPARDFELRQRHDVAMFSWASRRPERPVLIAGHTHRPVFWTSRPPDAESPEAVAQELARLRSEGAAAEALAEVRARLEFIQAKTRRSDKAALAIDPPCYFNTGCCSFGDGDVTGLELIGGEIRLVRWPDDDDRPKPKILAKADLREVLAVVSAGSSREHLEDGGR
jgi:hypothetical protein